MEGASPKAAQLFDRIEERLVGLPLLAVWVVLVHVVLLVYRPALPGPFHFDGLHAIVQNEDLRHPEEPWRLLGDHENSLTFDRRPVTGLSFLLSFQLSGLNPKPYRVVNLCLHLLTGVLLFRLMFEIAGRFQARTPRFLSLVVAGLWLLHPIGTSAVSYIYQRSEVLMSLFFVLSLYGLVRADRSEQHGVGWLVVAGAAAILSTLSKEVGVTLFIALPLIDRICLTDTWKETWRLRKWFYVALWVGLSAVLFWQLTGVRSQDIGHGEGLSTPWGYFKAQCGVLVRYLRLVIWPYPQLFFGAPQEPASLLQWFPQATFLSILFGIGILKGLKHRWLLIPIALFLVILAPTSSFVPISTEPDVEFRMYLPSAMALSLLVLGFFSLIVKAGSSQRVALAILLVCAGALGLRTSSRNHDYTSSVRLWNSVVRHDSSNVVAWGGLGTALLVSGDIPGAAQCGKKLVELAEVYESREAADLGLRILSLVNIEREENVAQSTALLLEIRESRPDLAEIDAHCAFALVRAGKPDPASRLLEPMSAIRRRQPHIRRIEAEIALAENNIERASAILGDFNAEAPTAWITRDLEARVREWESAENGQQKGRPQGGPNDQGLDP